MIRNTSIVFTILLCLAMGQAHGAGLLTPKGQPASLEIKQHHVDVSVNHSFAVIEIEQVFANPHDRTFEAVYSFPVPENASVGEFTYWINGVPVHAEVFKKKEARSLYEQEKQAGRNAALVEKNSFVDFQISVSQILPGDDVRLKLVYLQPVTVDHGIARFVYPLESGGTDAEQVAFWTANEVVEESFSFDLELNSSYAVDDIRLPAHPQALVSSQDAQRWQVQLSNQVSAKQANVSEAGAAEAGTSGQVQKMKLNQDIVVYWRLADGLPGSVDMMTYRAEGKDRGTFMMTVTPGNDLAAIETGRDWIVVLDYSGSMEGKYDTLIRGVEQGFQKFSPRDRVKIVLFNDRPRLLQRGFTPADPNGLNNLVQKLRQARPSGGTNLYAGLEMAIDELDADRTSAIWLVTDGVANVGETRQQKFISMLGQQDIRLFTFIMGNGANRPLLQGLAKASNGFAVNVSNSDDIVGHLLNAASKVSHQSFRDINVDFSGVKVGAVKPAKFGSVYRGQQLVLMGHYWGSGQLSMQVSAKVGNDIRTYSTEFEIPEHNEQFPELERMWAFSQIKALVGQQQDFGEDADRTQAITDLALEYGLLTDYTSMLVLEEQVFAALGIDRRNASRVELEHQARQVRVNDPLVTTRVDQAKPMFNQPRATHSNSKSSGGGSLGYVMVIALLLLLAMRRFKQLTRNLQTLS